LFVQTLEIIGVEVLLPSLIRKPLILVQKCIEQCLNSSFQDPETSGQVYVAPSEVAAESKLLSVSLASRQPSLSASQLVLVYWNTPREPLKAPHRMAAAILPVAYLPLPVIGIVAVLISSIIMVFLIFLWYTSPISIVIIVVLCVIALLVAWRLGNHSTIQPASAHTTDEHAKEAPSAAVPSALPATLGNSNHEPIDPMHQPSPFSKYPNSGSASNPSKSSNYSSISSNVDNSEYLVNHHCANGEILVESEDEDDDCRSLMSLSSYSDLS
jgi:hypothetical protein